MLKKTIGTIEYELIKGYNYRADLIKVREIHPSNDGSIYLSREEIQALYNQAFNT